MAFEDCVNNWKYCTTVCL